MLKNIYDYVCFDIAEYIKQIERIVPSEPNFVFRQTLDYILPTTLIKMTGCLEHKLDMINLQLSIDDEQKRQHLLREHSSIPATSRDVEDVVLSMDNERRLLLGNNELRKDKEDMWKNKEVFFDKIQYISTLIHGSYLYMYLSKEDNLLTLALDTSNNYVSNQISIYDLDETGKLKKSKKGDPIIKSESPYKIFYNQAIRFRNIYAHNEDSVYIEGFSPQKLSSESTVLDNWVFRFAAVLYVDSAIRDAFRTYMATRTSIMLS